MSRVALCGCLPAALGAFDFGLLALAGPRIAPTIGADGAAYPWLFSSASFAYGAAVMPAAVLTSRLGPPRALATGLAGAAAGALTLAAARDLVPALAGRVIAGAGGALAATAGLALLSAIADPPARRAAFAGVGSAGAAGFAVGALAAASAQWRFALVAVAAVAIGWPPASPSGAWIALLPSTGSHRSVAPSWRTLWVSPPGRQSSCSRH